MLIPVVAGVAALAIAAAAVFFLVIKPETDSLAAYSTAADELLAAQTAAQDARESVAAQLDAAATTSTSAAALADAVGPAYVADVSTLAAVRSAAEPLAALSTAGVPELAEVTIPDAPSAREERATAAAALREQIPAIEATASAFADQAQQVTDAIAGVRAAMDAVLASAHTTGTADALPALASADTVAAYSAAVEALASPSEDADRLALLTAYTDAWKAGIASAETAARAQESASEPTIIRGILIANKTFGLPSTYGDGLTAETQSAFATMKAAAAAEGLNLYISSGFRSYATQNGLYNKYVANDGKADADRYSARPGHSEHQSGLAFDLNTISESFGGTPAGIWVAEHGHEYGFIVRYPQGKEDVTGYKWEPWHIRYVGVDAATKLHDSGLTVEEYLGITSSYE